MADLSSGLTVAVTGPTGDIGRSLLAALEESNAVGRVVGMARRPFDPSERGWSKVEYRQGDVLDRASVDRLVEGADVVVHLAFIIFGDDREETRRVNLEGSGNVFRAAVDANVPRLVYTSSVAAYGFHPDHPELLREDLPPRATEEFYYSAQKAQLESQLYEVLETSPVQAYVFRPCIVAGPDALTLVQSLTDQFELGGLLPGVGDLISRLPLVRPVLPDPGVPLQLVHHDDVATALVAAIEGRGRPGIYNLAAPGEISMSDVARELGWQPLPIPRVAARAAAALVSRLGTLLPQDFAWIEAIQVPVLMDTEKAERELQWLPRHTTYDTLTQTVEAARRAGMI